MATKYIDADLIRIEIERLYYNEAKKDESILAADAYKNALDAVEKFLDSIPEQPAGWDDENAADKKAVKEIVKTVHKEVTRQVKEMVGKQPMDIPSAGSGAVSTTPPKFKLEVKKQPASERLEEEYKDYVENDPVYSKLVNRNAGLGIARHFAEWGMNQRPLPEDTAIFLKGVAEGKRLMMEGAVEGYVNYYEDSGGILMAEAQVGCPYHTGDKVKIIVIKEDEK